MPIVRGAGLRMRSIPVFFAAKHAGSCRFFGEIERWRSILTSVPILAFVSPTLRLCNWFWVKILKNALRFLSVVCNVKWPTCNRQKGMLNLNFNWNFRLLRNFYDRIAEFEFYLNKNEENNFSGHSFDFSLVHHWPEDGSSLFEFYFKFHQKTFFSFYNSFTIDHL